MSGILRRKVTNGVPFGSLHHAAYFNDDWKIRPNLTREFSAGLRK
jgi:hypothetical protein